MTQASLNVRKTNFYNSQLKQTLEKNLKWRKAIDRTMAIIVKEWMLMMAEHAAGCFGGCLLSLLKMAGAVWLVHVGLAWPFGQILDIAEIL